MVLKSLKSALPSRQTGSTNNSPRNFLETLESGGTKSLQESSSKKESPPCPRKFKLPETNSSPLKNDGNFRDDIFIPGSSFCVENLCQKSAKKPNQKAEILHIWKI